MWQPLEAIYQSVYKAIMRHAQDKNPSANNDQTPLHFAAKYCNAELCKLIMDNVDEKNPVDNLGRTPKQLMYAQVTRMQEMFDDYKWLSETFSPSNLINNKNLESLYVLQNYMCF